MTNNDLTHKKQRFDDAVFAAINLDHKHLTIERELQTIKWLAYRFMSPLAATKLFYDVYRSLRVDYVREHKDLELANQLPVVRFEDYVKEPKNLTSAWTARQAADTFCVPYELYIEFGMWFWSRRSGGGRSNTPQINQLGYTKNTEEAWLHGFQMHIKDRAWLEARSLAKVPQLHPSAFEATPEQVAARSYILELCSQGAASWSGAIEMWCYSYPVLTPQCFASVVPQDVLNKAIETVALTPRNPVVQPEPIPPSVLWPSCHGMPDAMDLDSETCTHCLFSATCRSLASMVNSEVHRRTGHKNPRKVALRATANARQRRHTAKKRATAAVMDASPPSPAAFPPPE